MPNSHEACLPHGLAALLVACSSSVAAASAGDAPDFERDVAPVLVNHCLDCHQPTKKSGELNLSTRASLLAGGESGAALAAGGEGESLLLKRVESGAMPPPDAKDAHPLSAEQVGVLRAWVAAGAPWPEGRELGVHERTVDLAKAR